MCSMRCRPMSFAPATGEKGRSDRTNTYLDKNRCRIFVRFVPVPLTGKKWREEMTMEELIGGLPPYAKDMKLNYLLAGKAEHGADPAAAMGNRCPPLRSQPVIPNGLLPRLQRREAAGLTPGRTRRGQGQLQPSWDEQHLLPVSSA